MKFVGSTGCLLLASLLWAPLASACSCSATSADLNQYARLYTGYFTSVTLHQGPSKKTPPYYELHGELEVTATYQGEVIPVLKLRSYFSARNCGMPLTVGVEYLVALGPEGIRLSRCSATGPLTQLLREQLQALAEQQVLKGKSD